MFEKIKFNKNFPLIKPYINNKEIIESLLTNKEFNEYYKEDYQNL